MKKEIAKVLNIKRLNNSYFGNPRYSIKLEFDSGEKKRLYTENDSTLGYQICQSWEGHRFTVEYNNKIIHKMDAPF